MIPCITFWLHLKHFGGNRLFWVHTFDMATTSPVAQPAPSDGGWPLALALIAQRHGGFITADAAVEAGISRAWISRLRSRGILERRSQGLYRIADWPTTPFEELREAVLWTGGRGFIGGASALQLWGLEDVVPRHIDLIVGPDYRPRREGGKAYRIRRWNPKFGQPEILHNIPVLNAKDAIADAIAQGLPGRSMMKAIEHAGARELINRREAGHLVVQLDDRDRRFDQDVRGAARELQGDNG